MFSCLKCKNDKERKFVIKFQMHQVDLYYVINHLESRTFGVKEKSNLLYHQEQKKKHSNHFACSSTFTRSTQQCYNHKTSTFLIFSTRRGRNISPSVAVLCLLPILSSSKKQLRFVHKTHSILLDLALIHTLSHTSRSFTSLSFSVLIFVSGSFRVTGAHCSGMILYSAEKPCSDVSPADRCGSPKAPESTINPLSPWVSLGAHDFISLSRCWLSLAHTISLPLFFSGMFAIGWTIATLFALVCC